MQNYKVIDEIITEEQDWKITLEGQPNEELNFDTTTQNLKESIIRNLIELDNMDYQKRMKARYDKFRKMGEWVSK